MRKAWLWVTVVVPLIPLAPGCGDGDSTKTQPSGAAGAADGEAGDTGVGEAGGPTGSGEAGAPTSSGGEAGGAAGEPGLGGAPSNGGTAGTGGTSGGSGGTGGTNGGTLVACLHPYGTYCTEFTGSSDGANAFAMRCSNLEMMPDSDCSREGVSGVCSWTEGENGEESYQRFHYQLEADELEEAESDCDAYSGTWATP